MWIYGSIWDASSWATENGRYKADYRYQPFVSRLNNFKIAGCSAFAPRSCHPMSSSPSGDGLSPQQYAAMQWVQRNHMVYYYCQDFSRDRSLTPECWSKKAHEMPIFSVLHDLFATFHLQLLSSSEGLPFYSFSGWGVMVLAHFMNMGCWSMWKRVWHSRHLQAIWKSTWCI